MDSSESNPKLHRDHGQATLLPTVLGVKGFYLQQVVKDDQESNPPPPEGL